MDDGLSESLTKIAEGFVGAFSHLDRCIHEVKDDVSELKDDVKRIEDGMGRMEDGLYRTSKAVQ